MSTNISKNLLTVSTDVTNWHYILSCTDVRSFVFITGPMGSYGRVFKSCVRLEDLHFESQTTACKENTGQGRGRNREWIGDYCNNEV